LVFDAAAPALSKPPSSPDTANLREPSATDTDNCAKTFPANGPLLITLQRSRRLPALHPMSGRGGSVGSRPAAGVGRNVCPLSAAGRAIPVCCRSAPRQGSSAVCRRPVLPSRPLPSHSRSPRRLHSPEISGGDYEVPAMQGDARDGLTPTRETYFLDFAKEMLLTARMPLIVTGGIRQIEVVERVLAIGISICRDGVGAGNARRGSLRSSHRCGRRLRRRWRRPALPAR
jgi:hypothetical protein